VGLLFCTCLERSWDADLFARFGRTGKPHSFFAASRTCCLGYRWRESCPEKREASQNPSLGRSSLRDESAALKAIVALRRDITIMTPRIESEAADSRGNVRAYRQRELRTENQWRALSRDYLRGLLASHAHSPELVAPDRNLYECAFLTRRTPRLLPYPHRLVRQSAKRRTAPDVLLPSEIQPTARSLRIEKSSGFSAAGTGLRMSDLVLLKWHDVGLCRETSHVLRSRFKQSSARVNRASQKRCPRSTFSSDSSRLASLCSLSAQPPGTGSSPVRSLRGGFPFGDRP